jgi:hypothetical protein
MLFFDWQIFYERQYYYNKSWANFDTKIRQICEICKFGVGVLCVVQRTTHTQGGMFGEVCNVERFFDLLICYAFGICFCQFVCYIQNKRATLLCRYF